MNKTKLKNIYIVPRSESFLFPSRLPSALVAWETCLAGGAVARFTHCCRSSRAVKHGRNNGRIRVSRCCPGSTALSSQLHRSQIAFALLLDVLLLAWLSFPLTTAVSLRLTTALNHNHEDLFFGSSVHTSSPSQNSTDNSVLRVLWKVVESNHRRASPSCQLSAPFLSANLPLLSCLALIRKVLPSFIAPRFHRGILPPLPSH